MSEAIQLLQEISGGSWEASLITTYNAWLPFYENVVLRRLRKAGSLHNVVLLDTAQCAAALRTPEQRPRLAGTDYSLLPVRAGGAFHPKLLVLVGRREVRVVIGSHNLTLSGFGRNLEVTSVVRATSRAHTAELRTFHDVLTFLRAWCTALPEELRETIDALLRFAPPWAQAAPRTSTELQFLASMPSGTSPWEQLRAQVQGRVHRALLLGPYFDAELAFLRRVLDDLSPSEMVVAIDPQAAVLFVERAKQLPRTRFVSTTAWAGRLNHEGVVLHAKALALDTDEGEWLIAGSANPSAPAWLADPPRRNAEVCWVRRGEDGTRGPADELGLWELWSAPDVTNAEWAMVYERSSQRRIETLDEVSEAVVAIETPDGFELHGVGAAVGITRATLRSYDDSVLLTISNGDGSSRRLSVEEPAKRARCVDILLEQRDGSPLRALVHPTDVLREHATTGRQRDLRRALATLETDPTQLEALLKIVEKVIFDAPDDSTAGASASSPSASDAPHPSSEPMTLSVSLATPAGTRTSKRLSDGDLGTLIDVLFHKLGAAAGASTEAAGPSLRREGEPSDDEDDELPDVSAEDGHTIALQVRVKIKRMLRRLDDRVGEVASDASGARRVLLQVAGVLGLLRALRNAERRTEWLPRGEGLLPEDACGELLWTLLCGFWRPGAPVLAGLRADGSLDGGSVELTMVCGLCGWLGHMCGLDVRAVFDAPLKVEHAQMRDLAMFAWLAPHIAGDADAVTLLRESILTTSRHASDGEEWVHAHDRWWRAIATLAEDPTRFSTAVEVERGDLVLPRRVREGAPRSPALVVEVAGNKVVVLDDTEPSRERSYVRDYLLRVARRELG